MAVAATQFFNYIDAFIDYRKTIYETSDETIRSNCIDLNLFRDFVKEHKAKSIDGPTVMGFQYYLKKQRKNSGPSINRKLFALRSYGHFIKLEQVPGADKLPFYDVLKVRGGYRQKPDALTHQQVKMLFDSIDRSNFLGIRDYAVYAVMYSLGLRVGEVYQLNLNDINSENKTLTVLGKGNRRRELYLNPEVLQVLSEWLAVRHNFKNSELSNALFISKKGNRLAIRTIEDNMRKLVDRLEFKLHFRVTCHTLRHTFASHLNDNGEDILVIQSLLGHASPRSTKIYIHPSQKRIREALEKLPGVLYLNQLLEAGVLNLNFQPKHRQNE
jgi:site-specific recombinase XerD